MPGAGEWTGTLSGTNPGFVERRCFDLVPTTSSPLATPANLRPPRIIVSISIATFPPAYQPRRQLVAVGSETPRTVDGQIDIGAFESAGDLIFADGFD